MTKLSKEQIDEIVEARELGVSMGMLARKYGVSNDTIVYYCDQNGVIPPKGVRRMMGSCGGGVAVTQAESDEMRDLSLAGNTPYKIARIIGRPYSTVRYRLFRDALLEEAQNV